MNDAEKVVMLAMTRRFLEGLASDPGFTTALKPEMFNELAPLLIRVAQIIGDHRREMIRQGAWEYDVAERGARGLNTML